MIVVRNRFQLTFGKAKEAQALWKEGMQFVDKGGARSARMLTDVTGPSYVMEMEFTYDSLTAFEEGTKKIFSSADWQAWYKKFVPLVQSGERTIMTIVE
jgi:ascorbate-specific PTS system EIIC-type component UlaA